MPEVVRPPAPIVEPLETKAVLAPTRSRNCTTVIPANSPISWLEPAVAVGETVI